MPAGSAYPVARLVAAFTIMAIGGVVMYSSIVALEPVATEFGTGRGAGSLPYTLFMLGFGFGGVLMGRWSVRNSSVRVRNSFKSTPRVHSARFRRPHCCNSRITDCVGTMTAEEGPWNQRNHS